MIEMTEQEKNLLAAVFPDPDRIREGRLFAYQEKALEALRAGEAYLLGRYPDLQAQILSFLPSDLQEPWSTLRFQDEWGAEYSVSITQTDSGYQCVDDYYAARIRPEYDALVESVLLNAGFKVYAHTSFPNPLGEEFPATGTVQELLALYPKLTRQTALYLCQGDDREDLTEQLHAILRDAGLYGSYTVWLVPGTELPEDRDKLPDGADKKLFQVFDI